MRRPLRSALTMLAIAISFLLFGVMHGVIAQFDEALTRMSDVRLRVMSRANILESIPLAYLERIRSVEGVTTVAPVVIFFGYYQDQLNQVSGGGVEVEEFLAVMPELKVSQAEVGAMQGNRIGALVGAALAERHGWRVGDRLPLKSLLWMNQDTGEDWQFEVSAIFNDAPGDDQLFAQEIYVHYDYIDEARSSERGTVNQYIVSIDDPGESSAIATTIDNLFANSSDETTTTNEKDYLRSQLQQVGDISAFVYSILGAVSFTLFFLTGTTMLQSMRERIPELGILKSMGFTGRSLFLLVTAESLIICLVGAMVGMAVAGLVFPGVFSSFGLSGVALESSVYGLGLLLAVVLAIAVAAWPAWRARQLDIASAIAGN